MQIIRSITELDNKIAECNQAELISDEAMRSLFRTFRMDLPPGLPSDPFSPEYREAQLALYRDIAGTSYSTAREATNFDVNAAIASPFPFSTGSTAVAGDYMLGVGFCLQTMALAPKSRVLEFGPGWGLTSITLARLGHKVTLVEIEPCYCELIERQAKNLSLSIEIINADFFHAERETRTFDAILFYDCFHHCDDHMRLLKALFRLIAPNGRLFLGSEPISNEFVQPWGLRLDGSALWAIRKNGWMELGFREDYFAQALLRSGWFGRKRSIEGHNRLKVWEAQPSSEVTFRFSADDPEIRSEIGRIHNRHLVLDGLRPGTGLFGPYIDLPSGCYGACIFFEPGTYGKAAMDVAANGGNKCLAQKAILLSSDERVCIHLPFETAAEDRSIEVRLICERGFKATISCVEIKPLLPDEG